ncbi:MAG: sulfatase-like hydrolase/transferase [Anaerolineae bacterium]|jgi:hypothetical protein|nr:sulfatase-like hydrolase/transferase [Anaerolineae bacterium]MBT7075800.1 sulfatase-like hydrolase/transferase [Anaerolineae bacterium]
MKKNRWIITGTASLLLVAVGAYFWTMGLITSLENYRSLLHDTPPAPAAPLGWEENSPTRRVVFILVDGLRDDISRNAEVMPALNQLRAQGASATSHSQTPSYSAPGYSVINIGAWPYLSDGPAMNLDYELTPTWTQDNLFSAAHRAGLKTAISGYYWFEKLIPQEDVDASFYTPEEDDAADRAVVDAALPWLKSGDYQFLFIHLDQVDYAGHYEGGPQDPRWDAAAGRVDAYINEIVTELDLELDTVIITSDHGHIDRGGHGGHEEIVLTEPLILAGAGIAPGEYPDTQMIDFAPTIAALLGTNIPATSQGEVLFDMLTLTPKQKSAVESALDTQQRLLHSTFIEAFGGEALPIREDMGVVTGTEFAIDAMLLQNESDQRHTGFTIPLIFGIFPAYALFRVWNKKFAWLLGSAIIYIALYNFRYAILDHQVYSMSSLVGAEKLIVYNASTVSVAFGTTWLILMLKLEVFKKGVRETIETTLLLTVITLWLLLLPVLWHTAVNGMTVSWLLPNFPIMFRAFLSLVQAIMIPIIGILLVGVGAIISKIQKSS